MGAPITTGALCPQRSPSCLLPHPPPPCRTPGGGFWPSPPNSPHAEMDAAWVVWDDPLPAGPTPHDPCSALTCPRSRAQDLLAAAGVGRTDLCCEPEAGRQSSRSPYTLSNRGDPFCPCCPRSPRGLLQDPPPSQAPGSREDRRKRKRRQRPGGLAGWTPWERSLESAAAAVGNQQGAQQELWGV